MGWDITLKSDQVISPEQVQKCVDTLPKRLRGPFDCERGQWGWSTAVDVGLPKGRELRLSGSFGISGKVAEWAAEAFARRLEQQGHRIEIGVFE